MYMVTTYFKNLVADNVWQTSGAMPLPTEYWLALSATEPAADGTGVTEPGLETGYGRAQVVGLVAAVDGVVTNNGILTWPKQTAYGGAVAYWALYDAQSGGNVLMGGQLDGLKHLDADTLISVEHHGLTFNVLGD